MIKPAAKPTDCLKKKRSNVLQCLVNMLQILLQREHSNVQFSYGWLERFFSHPDLSCSCGCYILSQIFCAIFLLGWSRAEWPVVAWQPNQQSPITADIWLQSVSFPARHGCSLYMQIKWRYRCSCQPSVSSLYPAKRDQYQQFLQPQWMSELHSVANSAKHQRSSKFWLNTFSKALKC